jgi:NitT/TauT family transport system substrate-binding protein
MINIIARTAFAIAAWGSFALSGAAHAADRVTVGVASTVSDAPIYIAEAKKYYQDEGLDVRIVTFRAATDMVPMLATGQADVIAASASAGFYNAMMSGVKIKIVADKASSAPGYGATKIMIRKDHVDSGRFKGAADLKGMKVAMNAPGVANTATLNALLKSVGLKYSDVQTVNLPLPDHVAALANKSVDASASVEPAPALTIANGTALLVKADDEIIPNHQIGVLLYSEDLAGKKSDIGRRFMRSYLRAIRFYNGALKDGRFAGPNAEEVITILAAATPLKDIKIYKAITPTGMNPDGRLNVESLRSDLDFYTEQGWTTGRINLNEFVDNSFAEQAVKELGPYSR